MYFFKIWLYLYYLHIIQFFVSLHSTSHNSSRNFTSGHFILDRKHYPFFMHIITRAFVLPWLILSMTRMSPMCLLNKFLLMGSNSCWNILIPKKYRLRFENKCLKSLIIFNFYFFSGKRDFRRSSTCHYGNYDSWGNLQRS